MPAPTIHVTQDFSQPVYYPDCAASGAIARAFNSRTLGLPALIALQDLGVTVFIDNEPQSYLGEPPDFQPLGFAVAPRLRLINNTSGE